MSIQDRRYPKMLVAVTSTEPDRSSEVDTDFGRARYVLFVDLDSGDMEVFENQENIEGQQDFGIGLAHEVQDRNPEWILTGSIGQKAFQALTEAGIKIGTGASGTVRDTIKQFNFGEFESAIKPLPCKDQNKIDEKTDPGHVEFKDSKETQDNSRIYQTGDPNFPIYRPQVSSKRAPRQE